MFPVTPLLPPLPSGFDPISPDLGYSLAEAQAVNSNMFLPMFQTYIDNNPQRSAVWDFTSRHIVEEFSNLGRFLPVIYYDPKINPTVKVPVRRGSGCERR